MSDAPERIWADDAGGWWRLESDENPGALIEYVRADLHEALRRRIAELEAGNEVLAVVRDMLGNFWANARNEALEEAAWVVGLHPMEGRNATKVALAVAIRALKDRNETEPEREPDNLTDNLDNRLDGEREET